MNIVARKNISSKLKMSASEIGYYFYTNRYPQAKKNRMTKLPNEFLTRNPTAQIAHLVFANAQKPTQKTKRAITANASQNIIKNRNN